MTGFRLGTGGAQALFGVEPDLTCLGKIIGGGLPVGAFGGRRDLMEIFNPFDRRSIMHASTFSGKPMTMAAGLAAMQDLDEAATDRINGLGDRLRSGCDAAFRATGIKGHTSGCGSLAHVDHARHVLGLPLGHVVKVQGLGWELDPPA